MHFWNGSDFTYNFCQTVTFTLKEATEVVVDARATATGDAWGTWDDFYLYKDADIEPDGEDKDPDDGNKDPDKNPGVDPTPANPGVDTSKNGFVKENGITYYYKKGVVRTDSIPTL